MEEIKEITHIIFDYLQYTLKTNSLDQDRVSFSELRDLLNNGKIFTAEEFAHEVFYVICVAGFKQDYAKATCNRIIKLIEDKPDFDLNDLNDIYGNKNKVKAVFDVWKNRNKYQESFYNLKTIDEKVEYLGTLPFVGNITKYHLARNLGMNFVKYDIWIQRLGVALYGDENLVDKVNNSKLLPEIKNVCDIMFEKIWEETLEKKGYIDVVLWRSCQKNLLIINDNKVFINKNFKNKN